MHAFDFVTPASSDEAQALLVGGAGAQQAHTAVLAGGTDLMTLLKADLTRPTRLVNISRLDDWRGLRFDADGTLHIGALTTLADIERSAELAARLPILPLAVRDAASPQLRAMATVGGNLLQRNRCWYFRGETNCWLKGGDTCFARDGQNKYHAIFAQSPCIAVAPSDLAPALVALDAELLLETPDGGRTLAIADLYAPPTSEHRLGFHLPDGALIREIRVPAQPAAARGIYIKVMDRQAWAFALVSAAAQVALRDGRVEQARLVLGGVANGPWRVEAAERMLAGQRLTPELAAQVADAAVADATPFAHNRYKVPMAREVARRALLAASKA